MNERKLVIVGDQAFTEVENEYRLRLLERRRKQYRDAKYRAKSRDLNPDPVGFLHELRCSGPHIGNSRCVPIPVWTRKVT